MILNISSAQGGTIWSKGQAGGPVTSYGKSMLKSGNEESVLNKVFNLNFINSSSNLSRTKICYIFFS
jgi:hypothetical protein